VRKNCATEPLADEATYTDRPSGLTATPDAVPSGVP
jgi:hypothetical protein